MGEPTGAERQAAVNFVRELIANGEVQAELHEQIAPLLKEQAGAIVMQGTLKNTTAIVVSPWTVTKFIVRKTTSAAARIRARMQESKAQAAAQAAAGFTLVEVMIAVAAIGIIASIAIALCN